MSVADRLYYEDVKVGASIPPVLLPITLQRLVMEAAVNRDFSPIHHNMEVARAHGAADPFANTFFLQGLFERTLREWMGLTGTLRKLSFRMIQFNVAGEVITCRGTVIGKRVQDGEHLVELEVWHESTRGVTTRGTAVVGLPSRE